MIKFDILIFTLIISLFSFNCQSRNSNNKMVLKCIIYPTGITSETYLINIFENGQFEITYGNKSNNLENDDFDSIVLKQSVLLDKTDLETILNLKTQIAELKEIEKVVTKKGGWEVILMIGGKKYHFYYGEQKDTSLGKLIEMLKQISPLKIDIHSWS